MYHVAITGALSIALAATLGIAAYYAWSRATATPARTDQVVDSFALAWSDTEANYTQLWVSLEPGVGDRAEDKVSFMYRIEGSQEKAVTLGFAFGGELAKALRICEDQSWEVDNGVAFTDLPQVARESGMRLGGAPALSSVIADADLFVATATVPGDLGDKVADGSATDVYEMEGTVDCTADLSSLWQESAYGRRLTSISTSFAAPSTETNELYGANLVRVATDDSFSFERGTLEPNGARNGLSEWTISSGTRTTVNGYDIRVQDGVSALFTGYDSESLTNTWSLLAGVLLGLGATVLVSALSGGLDEILDRYAAKRPHRS